MSQPAKSIIITGGNTGLGYEAAHVIARQSKDCHIIIASRSVSNGESAVRTLMQATGSPNISSMQLDLASTASIRRFAAQFNQAGLPPLHAVLCNAGIQFVQETRTTADGIEATFGVNHVGHFLLVRLLLEQIQDGGRIVVVSSDAHDPSKRTGMPAPRYDHPDKMADPEHLSTLSPTSRGQIRYSTSKLCNLYFTYELARRIQQSQRSISVYAFNPGMMPGKHSSLTRDYNPILRFIWNYVMPLMRYFRSSIRTTKQSGADLANLVLNDRLSAQHNNGAYWDGPNVISSSDESYHEGRAAELWHWTSVRLGLGAEPF